MPTEPVWTWPSFTRFMDERFDHLDDRFETLAKALELQAKEYARRLDDLNHAHAEALRVQSTFVSFDKWEDKMISEAEARKLALERIDEKFASAINTLTSKLDEYITKTEARQNGIDQAIAAQKAAAEEAGRQVERQAKETQDQAAEQNRKTNRNLMIISLILTAIIVATNFLPVNVIP